jgi:hypothetical protein
MTTIAYAQGVLATDSRITSGGMIDGEAAKLFRLPGGALLGCGADPRYYGLTFEYLSVLDELTRTQVTSVAIATREAARAEYFGDHRPEGGRLFAVVIEPDGSAWEYGSSLIPCRSSFVDRYKFGAWGTGSSLAKGAIEMGATAAHAVAVASRYDTCTGGPVQWMRLQPAPTES